MLDIDAVGDQGSIGARQVGLAETDDQAHFADGRDAHGEREGIVGLFPDLDRLVGALGNERHKVADFDVWPLESNRLALRIVEDKTVGL